ncbi:hypothetical protein [Kribbella speibonae]|uniref:Uncharacterized protein n=1 Tax=Kribbella speibonae TaxID=1572660 RepID=A0ABY2AAT5_9ACTN|nr:hypothetical protein [Kribbella speibonae]TCC25391.1 hypothetical protein E0H58_14660 [Kribbella speibonae]
MLREMSAESIVSVVLGVVSVVLAAYAIWLSAVFYKAGSDAQERAREIANRMESSLDVLNSRLQGLQNETFTLVRDTVEGMRGALWLREDAPRAAVGDWQLILQNQMLSLRKELIDEVSRVSPLGAPGQAMLESVVDEIIRRSASAGASAGETQAREVILAQLRRAPSPRGIEAGELMTLVARMLPFGLVIRTLHDMRDSGQVTWRGTELGPDSMLALTESFPGTATYHDR